MKELQYSAQKCQDCLDKIVCLINTQIFLGRHSSVFVVYWLARLTTDLKGTGSRIKKSRSISKIYKISKTGRDHILDKTFLESPMIK